MITDVVPEIFYNAQHPIAKLSDGNHAGFTVRTRVYLWSPSGLQGKLRVAGSWGAEASVSLDQKGGASVAVVNVSASAEQVTKRSFCFGMCVRHFLMNLSSICQDRLGSNGERRFENSCFLSFSLTHTDQALVAEWQGHTASVQRKRDG